MLGAEASQPMQIFDFGLKFSSKNMEMRIPGTDAAGRAMQELMDLIALYASERCKGWSLFPVEMLLRIHFMLQWFNLSDLAMEEVLYFASEF